MLKRFLFAVAPMMLIAGSAMADDSLLSKVAAMDLDAATSAPAAVEDADNLGQADVDALLGDDEAASGEEAIAACFRRIGYGYGYRGYRGYCGYRSFYRPYCHSWNYSYYPTSYCYRPVTYSYFSPVYSGYWGCW